MSIEIDPSTKVVVIPIGIGHYEDLDTTDDPTGRRRFEDLEHIDDDLEQLSQLFRQPAYQEEKFQVLPPLSGTAGEITARLSKIAKLLRDRMVLLIWSGHAEVVAGLNQLRLATAETHKPLGPGDGLLPSELANKLGGSGADSLCLVFDTCESGQAAGAVAQVGSALIGAGFFHAISALFSTQAFELAEDGLFVRVLHKVLTQGPSAEAAAKIAAMGYGGFNPHSRLLRMSDVGEVLEIEFDLLPTPNVRRPLPLKVGSERGLFPNPLFKANAPPMTVAEERDRLMSTKDAQEHFLPKAKGLEPGEPGWVFAGRKNVSREIVDWLDPSKPPHENLYVLTGDGGTGKSAILGRMVALSDAGFRREAARSGWNRGSEARGTLPKLGSIDAALHLRNLTAEAVVVTLAELLRIGLETSDIASFVAATPTTLGRTKRTITVVLDALDEAVEPGRIADLIINPLVKKGWHLLVGSRPRTHGDQALVDRLGPATIRDLTHEPSTSEDIAEYVERRLGDPASPYSDDPTLRAALAEGIAQRANGRFLYARITVDGLLRRPKVPRERVGDILADGIADAFSQELEKLDAEFAAEFDRPDDGATNLLSALAWSEGGGLPLRDLWAPVATALASEAHPYEDRHLRWLLREAGRFIVVGGDGEQAVYRLFHESLNEYLRSRRDAAEAQGRIVAALLAHADAAGGWPRANPYAVRAALMHAVEQPALLEHLCTDFTFLARALDLLAVDGLLDQLDVVRRRSKSRIVQIVAAAIRSARVALSHDTGELAAQLYARLHHELEPGLRRLCDAIPAAAPPVWLRALTPGLDWRSELATVQTYPAKVRALAFGNIDGTPLIAVGAGTEVHFWDPRHGAPRSWSISNDDRRVTGLGFGSVAGRQVIAVASLYDGVIVVRDVRTGAAVVEIAEVGVGAPLIGPVPQGGADAVISATTQVRFRALDESVAVWWSTEEKSVLFLHGGSVRLARPMEPEWVEIDPETGRHHRVFGLLSKKVAFGKIDGVEVACYAGVSQSSLVAATVTVMSLEDSERLAESIDFEFRIRDMIVGSVDGVAFIAAANDTDFEVGHVAVRQLGIAAGSLDQSRAHWGQRASAVAPIHGLGRSESSIVISVTSRGPSRQIELVDAVEMTPYTEAADRIRWLAGVASPPPERIAPHSPPKQRVKLTKKNPEAWPITAQTFGSLGDRPVEVCGSHYGALWIFAVDTGEVLHGPFVEGHLSVDLPLRRLKTARRTSREPIRAVSLGTAEGRAVVAAVWRGRVVVYDVATEQRRCEFDEEGQATAVALNEALCRSLIATGREGGLITLRDLVTGETLARIVLDGSIAELWLADGVLIARAGGRVHTFEIATNPPGATDSEPPIVKAES